MPKNETPTPDDNGFTVVSVSKAVRAKMDADIEKLKASNPVLKNKKLSYNDIITTYQESYENAG